MSQDNIINEFQKNLSEATNIINPNTTLPYGIEICKKVIGKYDNLMELYNNLHYISGRNDIGQIIKLFSLLCFNLINLIIAIKTKNVSLQKESRLKIEVIQEGICECV